MPKQDIEELKKLSPEERIRKLKKLQEKDKEEIEKAQNLIQESEDQLEKQEQTKKIPIPQLKAVNIDALFSPEEKELFKAKRFVAEKRKELEESLIPEKKPAELEQIAEQAPGLTPEQEQAQTQYLNQLSQKPAEDLYDRIKGIYQQVKETGEMTPDQIGDLNNIDYAMRRKMQDIEAGKYTEITKETAREMILTEKMKTWLQDAYGRR